MSQIATQIADGIARIILARPPINALTLDLIRDLTAALRAVSADQAVGCVVLESAITGRFSAGLDLPWLLEQDAATVRATIHELYTALYDVQHTLGKPSIAAVNGTARGGGMTMAISCDVIVAADSATFGYPEIDLGVPPAIHFAHLPRIIGRHRAFELLFSGRSFGADEAQRLGLVSRVVPAAEFGACALGLAREFLAKPRAGLVAARRAFMRQNDLDYRRSIAVAVDDFCLAYAMPETQATMRGFVARLGARGRT